MFKEAFVIYSKYIFKIFFYPIKESESSCDVKMFRTFLKNKILLVIYYDIPSSL